MIDNLHLFLRVSDVLIDLLICKLRRHDAIEKVKKFTAFDSEKYAHLDAYQNFVTSLKIPGFSFYVGKTSKALKCCTLTGPEKLKVLQHIDIQKLLPKVETEKCARIQRLWTELLALNQIFSTPAESLPKSKIKEFERRARQWGRDFINTYHADRVTPYIHAMVNHVGEFMKIHGAILPFTQQGLEKQNDTLTKNYFRSSCLQGETALRQLVEKQNRLEYLSDLGAKRQKRFEITCSKCKQKGHNRLTCALTTDPSS